MIKSKIFSLLTIAIIATLALADELNFDNPQLIPKKEEPAADSGPWNKITPSFDLRALGLVKESPENAGRQGFGIMQSILGLDFAAEADTSIVTRYDMGFMRSGTRDVYVDFQGIPALNGLKIGRFNLTFGHRLSDHRIYVKKFFGVSVNDFETGIEAKKNFGALSLTTSLVQGLGTGEAFQNNEQVITPAIDVRGDFDLGASEWTLGTSAFQTYRLQGRATSANDRTFALTAFGKMKLAKLGLWGEATWGWKRSLLVGDLASFAGDSSYATSVKDKKSLGFWGRVDYDLAAKVLLFYEYDQIVFDTNYHADRFQKHSLGSKFGLTSSSELEARLEFPREGRKSHPDLRRSNDSAMLVLHAWF